MNNWTESPPAPEFSIECDILGSRWNCIDICRHNYISPPLVLTFQKNNITTKVSAETRTQLITFWSYNVISWNAFGLSVLQVGQFYLLTQPLSVKGAMLAIKICFQKSGSLSRSACRHKSLSQLHFIWKNMQFIFQNVPQASLLPL